MQIPMLHSFGYQEEDKRKGTRSNLYNSNKNNAVPTNHNPAHSAKTNQTPFVSLGELLQRIQNSRVE